MAATKKTAFMGWLDAELGSDPTLARQVDEILGALRLEQDIVALRERRGLSQRDLAKLLGTSQPYVARLESGRVKNIELRTLARCATALGGTLRVSIAPRPVARRARSAARTRPRTAGSR